VVWDWAQTLVGGIWKTQQTGRCSKFSTGAGDLENKNGRPRHGRNLERREGGRFSTLATFFEPPTLPLPPLVGQPGVQHLRNWKRASALMVFNVSKAPYPRPLDPKPKFNVEVVPLRGLIAFSTFSKLRTFFREGQVAPAVVGGANPQRAREGREGVGC
jgi:hypothetical protein